MKLNVVSDVRGPHAFCLLLNLNIKLYIVLQLVVLWVGRALAKIGLSASFALLAMPEIVCSQNTGLLEDPVEHFLAELVVVRALKSAGA